MQEPGSIGPFILNPGCVYRQRTDIWFYQVTASWVTHRSLAPDLHLQAVIIQFYDVTAKQRITYDPINPFTVYCGKNGIIVDMEIQAVNIATREPQGLFIEKAYLLDAKYRGLSGLKELAII